MIGRLLFLSAAAFVGYKYIRRSNQKAQREIAEAPGTVQILPPDSTPQIAGSGATEPGRPARTTPSISAAAEDLSGR